MIAALLAVAIGAAFPPPAPHSVAVEISGVMSGPTRIYIDLDSGVLLEGRLPRGAPIGDGADVAPKDLPVTDVVSISETLQARLSDLAAAMLRDGYESGALCYPTIDRMIRLEVSSEGGVKSDWVFCPSADAEALVDAIFAARDGKP